MMPLPRQLKNERGLVLLYYVIISLFVLSGALWYARWSWMQGRQTVSSTGGSRAMIYAESGVNAARQWLKSPTLNRDLPIGTSHQYQMLEADDGRYDVALYRTSADSSLVEGFATGYFYLPSGPITDPLNGRSAVRATINVKYRVTNASTFLFALPNDLQIDSGSDLGSGVIYAKDLIFQGSAKLGAAYYFSSVSPSEAPTDVVFTSAPFHAQRLPYPLNFAALDSNVQESYKGRAAPGPLPAFEGFVSDVPGTPVYYADHDIDIAQNQDLTVNGVFVIYSTGSVVIHRNIVMANEQSWLAIISEKDIRIAADAPNTLVLNANFFANRKFKADAPIRPLTSSIQITGGITCLQNLAIGNIWQGTRQYTYKFSEDPRLLLPNFSEIIEYKAR